MTTDVSTLIVGCGYLGRRVGRRLALWHEQRVMGTTRSETKGAEMSDLGIEPAIADVLDFASLTVLPAVDRVLYCVGFDRTAGVPMRTVYLDGLANALQALAGRTRRFVYVSATSVYGQNDGGWVDEDSPAEPSTESGRICLDAENLARRVCAEHGMELVVVRYSGLYGPGRIIRREALLRGEPIVGDPLHWLNLIHIDDAAAAAILALDLGIAGRVYLASDDRPVERREYYSCAATWLDAPVPRFVSPENGRIEARREEANKRVSNARIKAELGLALTYPTLREGLPAAIEAESLRS
jgi:nucleoside-diphosphate-sugar epimerase